MSDTLDEGMTHDYVPLMLYKWNKSSFFPFRFNQLVNRIHIHRGWAHEVLFRRQEPRGINMCARSLHPSAEMCSGCGVAKNTVLSLELFWFSRWNGTDMRLLGARHLLVIVFWGLIFLDFGQGPLACGSRCVSVAKCSVSDDGVGLYLQGSFSVGLEEGGLSTSQAWDQHQKEWFWVLLWGVGFVPALILISTVSEDEIVFILCFGILRDLSPWVLSSLSYDFSFHSLLSNLPMDSVMSHLTTSNTFLKAAALPCCHSVSLLPLEAKPLAVDTPVIAVTQIARPWLCSLKALSDSFWVKSNGYFSPPLS